MVAWTLRKTRTVIVAVIGVTVLGIGISMLALPGPAIVVIPVGLAILSTEFVWAKNLLNRSKTYIAAMKERMASRNKL